MSAICYCFRVNFNFLLYVTSLILFTLVEPFLSSCYILGTVQGTLDRLEERVGPNLLCFLLPQYRMFWTLTCDFFEGKEHVLLLLFGAPNIWPHPWKGLLCLKYSEWFLASSAFMKGTVSNLGSQKRAFILLFAVTKIKDRLGTSSLISGLPQCFTAL